MSEKIYKFADILYPYRKILLLVSCFMFLLFVAFVVLRVSISLKEQKEAKRKKRLSDTEISNLSKGGGSVYDRKLAMRQLVAPDGVNPYPLSYTVLNDAGKDLYYRTFTIDKLPKRTKFATTFRGLFDFEGCTSTIYINPLTEEQAASKLDRHIVVLEGEIISAQKDSDTNRVRKINGQLIDAQKWAKRIELGENSFYDVGFLFTIHAESPEELDLRSDTFNGIAAEKMIELSACYGVQPEAFQSTAPYNDIRSGRLGPVKLSTVKWIRMDKLSLSTIFNHTQEDFTHENGVPLGENMRTGRPVFYDPYDKSHNGYGLVAAGMTGTGKSGTIKMLTKRLSYFGYRYVCIDSQTIPIQRRGEYSPLADALGGVTYEVCSRSNNVLNIFDVDEEVVVQHTSNGKVEVRTLNLLDKITNIAKVIQTMVQGDKVKPEFKVASYINEVIADCINDVFMEKGIVDGDVESLYTVGQSIDGSQLTTGKVRKEMPTLSDFYRRALVRSKTEERESYKEAYALLIANIKPYIKEMYYSKDSLKFFTYDEYMELPQLKDDPSMRVYARNDNGRTVYEPVVAIKGMRNYYDGQSTIRISKNNIFTDIDISSLPDSEKPLARQVALLVIKENFVNKNSENTKKAEKLVVIVDEAHEEFPDESTRATLDNFYRTGRKKNVSVWLLTQAIVDFKYYKETESILKQSSMKLVFKQDSMDEDYIKKALNITDSQLQRILSLGGDVRELPNKKRSASRRGEVCIVDNRRVCFCNVRYLKRTEATVVETDPTELEKLSKSAS